jgi:hypothetical protein
VEAADASIKAMKNMLAAGRNGVTTKKLVNALVMADGDPGSVARLFEWAGQQGKGVFAAHQEYWINALLSGPRTQATNFMSNLMNTFVMPAERVIGGMFQGDLSTVKSGFRMYGGMLGSLMDVFHLSSAAERAGGQRSVVGSAMEAFRKEAPLLESFKG